jgi:hypothetical protein
LVIQVPEKQTTPKPSLNKSSDFEKSANLHKPTANHFKTSNEFVKLFKSDKPDENYEEK